MGHDELPVARAQLPAEDDDDELSTLMEPLSDRQLLKEEESARQRFNSAAQVAGTAAYHLHRAALADVPRPRRKRVRDTQAAEKFSGPSGACWRAAWSYARAACAFVSKLPSQWTLP